MSLSRIFPLFLIVVLTACAVDTEIRQQTASRIARPSFMVERSIPAGQFQLQAWERMHESGQPANVYIEGDGFRDYFGDEDKSIKYVFNPTPDNPVALHLASQDNAKNLAYIARPCQFIKNAEIKGCSEEYAKNRRHSPEVIRAYNRALDNIASLYNINGFNLIGYGGGANIAGILAAQRGDVLTLRTVAGDLNPDLVSDTKEETYLDADSVLAVDYGSELANVPQHHFIGSADDVVTPAAYHSYRQMLGLSECVHYSLIPDADHTNGWVEKWPELLELTPQCAVIHKDLPTLPPKPYIPNEDFGYKAPKMRGK